MPTMQASGHVGEIVWLGAVDPSIEENRVNSHAASSLNLTFAGADGEAHSGQTRPSCVRVTMLHPKGTEIRNTRQLSILSEEEMNAIAQELNLDAINPEWLGASIVIRGIPDFTHVPPASRLQSEQGTTLTVDIENGPCNWPGKEIERDAPGHGIGFKVAARDRRGLTAWVERPGKLSIGDQMKLFVPTQRGWQPDAP